MFTYNEGEKMYSEQGVKNTAGIHQIGDSTHDLWSILKRVKMANVVKIGTHEVNIILAYKIPGKIHRRPAVITSKR